MRSFFYSFLLINAIFNYVSFGNDVCRKFQVCRRNGICIEGNNCACREGTFGEFCDFRNADYENSLEFLRCENRGAEILDCQNEGVCIAFDQTQPYCACLNTEFTGDLCQFNRTCEPTCLTLEENDTGKTTCPAGQLRLFESCQDNGLPFTSTQIPAITTSPIVNATIGPLTEANFITILVIVNIIFLLIIVAISTSFTCVVFFVIRTIRRKRTRNRFQSHRLNRENGVPTTNGISNSNQQRSFPINHYEVPYDYVPDNRQVLPVIMQSHPIPPVSTVQTDLPQIPYEVPMQSIRVPLPIQRNRFPDTFRVNNRTYSIHSNISDLYFQLEEFHDNTESIAPSYAVIVPSASDRESTRNGIVRSSYKKSKNPPPVPPKPKHSLLSYWEPGKDFPSLFDQMHKSHYKELKTENLKLFNLVGKGEFGDVWKGTLDTPIGEIPVAIKLLKNTLGKQENISFLQEAAIIGQFNNINVLKLIGVVTLSEPKLIITELMEIQLRDYLLKLKKRPSLPFKEITSVFLGFCRGIAQGMAYLSQKGFIHRDLAARNILLDAQNECKIADFGMTRRLMDNDYYKMTDTAIIPLKWSAPESIFYKKYQSKSDVWSYAIVLFEIWSLGCKPWPFDKLESVISKLNQSILMPPPPGCPRDIYLTMVLCWHPEADKRPSFTELCRIFNETNIDSLEPPPGNGEDTQLGQDLCCSENLYKDLQYSYRRQTA